MEGKAMLPDSTQSETLPPTSGPARPKPSSGEGSLRGSSMTKTRDKSKKKSKRKSEDRGSKAPSKKKKTAGKDKPHKDESSKKSKKETSDLKKARPEGEDSDLDLETELKPIRDYLKDREEMLKQMFRCLLKANKLQAMLPDVLHGLKTEELQELCLRQLEGMSRTRILSILAGEEMQSSSDESDESDLDPARPHPEPAGSAEECQINSEVVDSTSSLLQVAPSLSEAEEAESPQEKEKVTAEEASLGNGDEAPEFQEDGDACSGSSSWHGNTAGQWDDQVAHDNEYNEMEMEEEMEGRDIDADGSVASSQPDGDLRDDPQNDRQAGVQAEAGVVRRAKKIRRVKIVRAEGEDCEEGEITSDEVETDAESVHSVGEEDGKSDAEDVGHHPASPGPGPATETLPNSGNQGGDDDNADVAVADTDDASACVAAAAVAVVDASRETVARTVVARETVARETVAGEIIAGRTVAAECDDSLIVYAEESLESEVEECCAAAVSQNVAGSADSSGGVVEEPVAVCGHAGSRDRANKVTRSEPGVEGDADVSTSAWDGAETLACAEAVGQGVTSDPASTGQRGGRAAAAAAAPVPARKVAQQLEVLELELRARAIRSLMKQYGKDVG